MVANLSLINLIFPKLDLTATFVLCVTFLSLFLVDSQLRDSLIHLFIEGVTYAPADSSTSFDDVFGFIMVPLLIGTALFAPLFLPFTDYDLRPFVVGIIIIDAFVIFAANLARFAEGGDYVNLVWAGYAFCWATYACEKRGTIFSKTRAKPKEALVAAAVSVISLSVLIHFLNTHWLNAYCAATLISCYLYGGVKVLVSHRAGEAHAADLEENTSER